MKLKIKNIAIITLTLFTPLIIMATPLVVPNTSTVAYAATGCTNAKDCLSGPKTSKIMDEILIIIRFLSALVLVIAVIMIIVGGIQYTTSGGNAQSVAAAKKKITDVFIGIMAYIFLWAFLEWLIPPGAL